MKKTTSVVAIAAIALVFLIPPPMPAFACGSEPFLGDICYESFNYAPKGYAFCNGQLLPINQNQALFSLLGTNYGGDGRTTFALPNMQGRIPIGFGQGPGLSNYVIGQTGGAETHTLTISEMPAHSHALIASNTQANTNDPNVHYTLARAYPLMYSTTTNNLVAMHSSSIGSTGGSQPFSMIHPYLTVTCTISLTGIFPLQN